MILFRKVLGGSLRKEVFKLLYYTGGMSCKEISDITFKSIPSVAKAISELKKMGIAVDGEISSSTGGRKAQLYKIKENCVYVVSVAMDQLYTTASIIDLSSNTSIFQQQLNLKLFHNDNSLYQLTDFIKETIKKSGIKKENLLGIGIGMPGFVNAATGENSTYLFTHNEMTIKQYLEKTFNVSVFIDNDSSTIALGESKFGLAKNKNDVMVVNIGWGIGLGMIVKGKLFRGSNGYAGELSHIPISENDILCECGKRGCLETEATLRTVSEKAAKGIEEGKFSIEKKKKSLEDIADSIMKAANKGDQYCIELFNDMAQKIGKALAILIHIVNPEQILLSGRASEVGKILLPGIQHSLNKYCIPMLMENVEIKVSTLQYDAYVMGAAVLVIENL